MEEEQHVQNLLELEVSKVLGPRLQNFDLICLFSEWKSSFRFGKDTDIKMLLR